MKREDLSEAIRGLRQASAAMMRLRDDCAANDGPLLAGQIEGQRQVVLFFEGEVLALRKAARG